MRLVFLGTRGEIETRSPQHRMHTSLLIEWRSRRVMVDCGIDWLDHLYALRPGAIVLTHAHPDHAGGLKRGAPCEVWATRDTWQRIGRYPIERRGMIEERRPASIGGIRLEAFGVEHSLLAPAVGYRIRAGRVTVFYAPDLVFIRDRRAALAGIAAYIGDGAAITRAIVRRRGARLIGHASVREQLEWCRAEAVPRAIVTHCGSEIVKADEAAAERKLAELAAEYGVRIDLAHDGMVIETGRGRAGGSTAVRSPRPAPRAAP